MHPERERKRLCHFYLSNSALPLSHRVQLPSVFVHVGRHHPFQDPIGEHSSRQDVRCDVIQELHVSLLVGEAATEASGGYQPCCDLASRYDLHCK